MAHNPRKSTHQLDVEVEDAVFKTKNVEIINGSKSVSNHILWFLEVKISNSHGGYNFGNFGNFGNFWLTIQNTANRQVQNLFLEVS